MCVRTLRQGAVEYFNADGRNCDPVRDNVILASGKFSVIL